MMYNLHGMIDFEKVAKIKVLTWCQMKPFSGHSKLVSREFRAGQAEEWA
jgi:hypothetical protein